jgi:hypothetical protein
MNAEGSSAKPDDSSGQPDAMPDRPRGAPFFQRNDWLSFGATTLLALLVYLFTLVPDVGLDNSGVWTTAAAYGGVSSPPGYPLWTLWAWAFTKLLPFSNVAWRAAVSSAVAGALACGLIALMVSRGGAAMLEQMPAERRLKPKEEDWLRVICGYAAGMVFGLNGAFWPQAVKVAVWPLSILLLCLVLCLLMRWTFQPEKRRYLYATAFAYGLLLTNSQIELALAPAIPILVVMGNLKVGRDLFLAAGLVFLLEQSGYGTKDYPFYIACSHHAHQMGEMIVFGLWGVVMMLTGVGLAIWTRRAFTEWKAVLMCSVLFMLGLALYFYLPVTSMTNPPVNWGNPRTVEGFFHAITRGQYERIAPSFFEWRFLEQMGWYWIAAGKNFGWPYLLLGLMPFCFLPRLAAVVRRWILGLLAAYVCLAFLMLAVLNPSRDRQSWELSQTYFSASYVVLVLWMGYGLVILGAWLTRPAEQPQKLISPSDHG